MLGPVIQPTWVAADALGAAAARAVVSGATAVSLAASAELAVLTGLRPIGRCRTGSRGTDGLAERAAAPVGTEQGSATAGGAATGATTETRAEADSKVTSRRRAGMTHLSG
ncbi:Uncharacterised protein [Mycolicibacterium fortuitum]|uniref:Uncharacterized protein n=1 Tax=Mycolicibacterium fortuitum TaxID=1766 RepID=A0A378USL2_MYCFO|nr:Uncharacterised protein [Mycolicibacterium fortuitum]